MGDDTDAPFRLIVSGLALGVVGVSMALTAFNMLPVLYGGEPCIGQDLSCTDQYTWSQEEADRASAYTLLSLAMLGTGGFISGYGLAKRYENGASVDE